MLAERPNPDTVAAALDLAVRAPSVHNSQPWRWRFDGGTLELFADRSRQLPATDPQGRGLVLSCGAALFAQLPHEHRGGAVVQQRPSRGDRAHGRDQLRPANVLDQEPTGPGEHGPHHGLLVHERGQHEAADMRRGGQQIAAQPHPAAVGQAHIQHGHIRPQRRHPAPGLGTGRGLADHGEIVGVLDEFANSEAYDLVIVDQEHRHHRRTSLPYRGSRPTQLRIPASRRWKRRTPATPHARRRDRRPTSRVRAAVLRAAVLRGRSSQGRSSRATTRRSARNPRYARSRSGSRSTAEGCTVATAR